MFFVINKEKIYAYVVSILTIVILFFMSSVMKSDINETEPVSSNSIQNVINSENTVQKEHDNVISNTVSEIVPND